MHDRDRPYLPGLARGRGHVNQVMIGRHLVARHARAAVNLAMELADGAGFYRAAGLERRFRDIFPSIGSSDDVPPHAGPGRDYSVFDCRS